jgi:hypothetical protein
MTGIEWDASARHPPDGSPGGCGWLKEGNYKGKSVKVYIPTSQNRDMAPVALWWVEENGQRQMQK